MDNLFLACEQALRGAFSAAHPYTHERPGGACSLANVFVFQAAPSEDFLKKVAKIPTMPTERCAKLMAVTMANNLDEVWIAEYPALPGPYLNQYFPNFFRWYVKILNTFIIEGA